MTLYLKLREIEEELGHYTFEKDYGIKDARDEQADRVSSQLGDAFSEVA